MQNDKDSIIDYIKGALASNVLELTIPASTANLGVGFDSIGMALDKFLHLSVKETSGTKWEYIFHDDASKQLPTDETNFILM